MLIFLGILQLVLIAALCLYEYKKGSLSVFLWAVLLLMFGIPHFIDLIRGDFKYSDRTYVISTFFVFGFCIVYLFTKTIIQRFLVFESPINILRGKLSYNTFVPKFEDSELIRLRDRYVIVLNILITAFFLLSIFLLVIEFGSLSSISWSSFRSVNKGIYNLKSILNVVLYIMQYLVYILGCLLFFGLLNHNIVSVLLSILVAFSFVTITRARSMLLPLLVPIILLVILKYKKIRAKEIAILGGLGIVSIYFVYAFRVFRFYGEISSFLQEFDFIEFNVRVFEMIFTDETGELGLRNIFYYFVENFNNFKYFGEGNTYTRILLFWLPTRLSSGIKPDDFAITMGSAWSGDWTNTTYSVHPTLFGDVYANFGYYGFLFAAVYGVVTYLVDYFCAKIRTDTNILIYPSVSLAYILIARGSVYNAFFIMMVCVIFIHISRWIFDIIYKRMRSHTS